MRQLTERETKLCRENAKLFEESLNFFQMSSPLFIKRFMLSNLTKSFDDGSFLLGGSDYRSVLDELAGKYRNEPFGKDRYSGDELYWIGYMYRAICSLHGLNSKQVFRLIPGREIRKHYYICHTLDPSYAAERLLEAVGFDASDDFERGYRIFKKVTIRDRNRKHPEAIETEHLLLRHFKMEDAGDMYRNWASDPEVTKYLTWWPHRNVEETKQIISLWLDELKDHETYHYAIVIKKTGEVIGATGIVNRNGNEAEIGYCLAKRYWNGGIMTEATKALIDRLLKSGFKKITARAHVDNEGSNRVLEKCGLKYIGEQRLEHHSDVKPESIIVNLFELKR